MLVPSANELALCITCSVQATAASTVVISGVECKGVPGDLTPACATDARGNYGACAKWGRWQAGQSSQSSAAGPPAPLLAAAGRERRQLGYCSQRRYQLRLGPAPANPASHPRLRQRWQLELWNRELARAAVRDAPQASRGTRVKLESIEGACSDCHCRRGASAEPLSDLFCPPIPCTVQKNGGASKSVNRAVAWGVLHSPAPCRAALSCARVACTPRA